MYTRSRKKIGKIIHGGGGGGGSTWGHNFYMGIIFVWARRMDQTRDLILGNFDSHLIIKVMAL